jgi:hypothetical protein
MKLEWCSNFCLLIRQTSIPLKESFLALKAWVRRNHQLKDGFKDFGDFLELTVEDFIEEKDAHGYFRLAGIGVISEDKDKSDADEEI